MTQEDKNLLLRAVCDDCNPESEAMLAIYSTKKKGDYYVKGDMELIKNGIRNILNEGIAGKESEPATILAWTLLSALRDIQDQGVSIDALLTAFDDDEVDCSTCDLNRVCNADEAIAFRKANGIPRPKKGSKGRKVKVN